jgi:hypothetical protein
VNGGWQVTRSGDQAVVSPVADIREHEHELDADLPCWCAPRNDDGVIVHNSADGREHDERRRALQ